MTLHATSPSPASPGLQIKVIRTLAVLGLGYYIARKVGQQSTAAPDLTSQDTDLPQLEEVPRDDSRGEISTGNPFSAPA